ncbi:MAG TPA: septal ring lytic transglycosylase RlpA family protein [Thermoanaerobaculia bacterium]|nr:septal ring lytic transglycosylase RlpA family protein [Thermoanaerobaculia bacterium]
MSATRTALFLGIGLSTLAAFTGAAQTPSCDDHSVLDTPPVICDQIDAETVPHAARYAEMAEKHKLSGLASSYSRSLDGTLTANGEIYRHEEMTAAHLTLPLGCWADVTSRATGRTVRVRVNDRGPYVRKFVLDLSRSAAHAIGVDVADDRHVEIRVIAMPGEEPPVEDGVSGQASR